MVLAGSCPEEAVTIAVTAMEAGPREQATQYLLWVDGVGGYLVCLGHRVTLGQANPTAPVDVALLADVSRHHATVQRDTEGYFLEAVRKVKLNGQPAERGLLRSGDRVTLGNSCQLQFWQTVPASTSARLDLVSGHRFVQPVQSIILMADTLVLGPGSQGHIAVPDLPQALIVYRNRGGLSVRWPGSLQVGSRTFQERAPLEVGTTVATEHVSLALDRMTR